MAHPSKSEGLSNTILEGMAAGLPVIGTREAAAEIIEHDRTGILVPACRPDALADALGRLFEDPPLRERLGTAGFEFVRHNCTADIAIRKFEHVYRSLLENMSA
jgi:glycosyltransferase involved in cell wall biosynthesis